MSAAGVLVHAGVRPTLIDDGAQVGGQGWRRPGPNLPVPIEKLLGRDYRAWQAGHAAFEAISGEIDHRARTSVWGVDKEILYISHPESGLGTLHADKVLIATGAVDKVAPMRGWTLPGVYTLGGAQTLLKSHAYAVGRRVVFCGSSPLLYLAAYQYAVAGADVAGVVDTTPFARKIGAALPMAMSNAPMLGRGLEYMGQLLRRKIPIVQGARSLSVEGDTAVEGLRYADGAGREHTISCDAVCYGYGLKPETQLAEIAGCTLEYEARFRHYVPRMDEDGRGGEGIYLAGDGSRIGGAEAARISGQLAAHAILADMGRPVPSETLERLRRKLARLRQFQHAMAGAFAWPHEDIKGVPDELAVCRCENVTAGEIRAAAAMPLGPTELNRAKAVSRVGMGRCQGRMCGAAASEILAGHLAVDHRDTGWVRAQAPIKPLEFSRNGS